MGRLNGKIALVTGAGQGVGQGIAYALAAEGARIAVTGLKWTAPGLAPWNVLVGLYMAQSVTHYEGLQAPWMPLQDRGVQLEVDTLVMGTIFVAHGICPGRRPRRRRIPRPWGHGLYSISLKNR